MMPRSLVLGALLGLLVIPACGAAEPGDLEETDEQDVSSTYTYHCRSAYDSRGSEVARIRLTRTRATLTSLDPGLDGAAGVYRYNPDYVPRAAAHQHDAQYVWNDPRSYRMVLLFDEAMR